MFVSTFLIAVGILLLVAGGETLLRGAVGMAAIMRLTPAVIGLTVVAAGTSIPELAVSGAAVWQSKTDIAVANVVGSNIFNITMIVGLCSLIRPIAIIGNTTKLEYPVLFLVTLLCLVIIQDGEVNRLDASLLLTVYIAFTAYIVSLVHEQVTSGEARVLGAEVSELTPPIARKGLANCIILLAAGVVLLAGGAHATVKGAVELARLLGWSERTIGLTIVSAGTGLPEVVASLVSSARGRGDIAIGNVIGSNLFNILAILGVCGAVKPLPVQRQLIAQDAWWMLGVTILLFPLLLTGRQVSRGEGGILVAIYAIFLGTILAG